MGQGVGPGEGTPGGDASVVLRYDAAVRYANPRGLHRQVRSRIWESMRVRRCTTGTRRTPQFSTKVEIHGFADVTPNGLYVRHHLPQYFLNGVASAWKVSASASLASHPAFTSSTRDAFSVRFAALQSAARSATLPGGSPSAASATASAPALSGRVAQSTPSAPFTLDGFPRCARRWHSPEPAVQTSKHLPTGVVPDQEWRRHGQSLPATLYCVISGCARSQGCDGSTTTMLVLRTCARRTPSQ